MSVGGLPAWPFITLTIAVALDVLGVLAALAISCKATIGLPERLRGRGRWARARVERLIAAAPELGKRSADLLDWERLRRRHTARALVLFLTPCLPVAVALLLAFGCFGAAMRLASEAHLSPPDHLRVVVTGVVGFALTFVVFLSVLFANVRIGRRLSTRRAELFVFAELVRALEALRRVSELSAARAMDERLQLAGSLRSAAAWLQDLYGRRLVPYGGPETPLMTGVGERHAAVVRSLVPHALLVAPQSTETLRAQLVDELEALVSGQLLQLQESDLASAVKPTRRSVPNRWPLLVAAGTVVTLVLGYQYAAAAVLGAKPLDSFLWIGGVVALVCVVFGLLGRTWAREVFSSVPLLAGRGSENSEDESEQPAASA